MGPTSSAVGVVRGGTELAKGRLEKRKFYNPSDNQFLDAPSGRIDHAHAQLSSQNGQSGD
jgi:hypothetical protein